MNPKINCNDLCNIPILLVDDVPFNTIFLEEMLMSCWGLRSISFENGYDALSCY